MKEKIKITIAAAAVAAISACVFTGCFSGNKNKGLQYAAVDEAIKSADNVLGNTYQNFTLPENINITVPDKLYTIKADLVDGCDRNEMIDKLTDVVLPGYKGTGTLTEEDDGKVAKCAYDNADVPATIWYYESGTFIYGRSPLTEPEGMFNNGKQYIIGKDDLSDSYILNGDQYSVKEAVDYAEKYVRENLMPFLPNDTDVKAESACAFKADETNYWIYVELEHYIEGCPLSTVGEPWLEHPFMRPSKLIITFDGKDKISQIANECYSHFAEKKEVDEILTLEAALKHLEKELAPNSSYTFKDVKLAYCARVDDVFKYEYEYRPTWCFTTRYGYASNAEINPREVIYVDALNGDVYCYSDIDLNMVF